MRSAYKKIVLQSCLVIELVMSQYEVHRQLHYDDNLLPIIMIR